MRAISLTLCTTLAACASPRAPAPALTHEAYVWQRDWTGPVREAVAGAPGELSGLRVLALELAAGDGAASWPDVDAAALARAGRPVTAVVRLDGSRPIADLSLDALAPRLAAWRAAGVDVAGVEIDHDCATAALADYAAWLERARPPAPLRWSITALPTWVDSPALPRLAAAVDQVVLQVHAIRAPRLFDRAEARSWLDRFAAAAGARDLRVALPTYAADVGGTRVAADPVEVAAFLRGLERAPVPGLVGVVWFRLPVATDTEAWPAATLDAVIAGAPLAPAVSAQLVARRPGAYDIVLTNPGNLDAAWPSVQLRGAVTAADLVGGYARYRAGWSPPQRVVRPGEQVVIGWATGEEIAIDAN